MSRSLFPRPSAHAARLAGTMMLLLSSAALPPARAETPTVANRYEEMLVRSPEKGTAFDKVYQYWFEHEGLENLAARWKEAAAKEEKEKSGSTYALLLGMLYERQGKGDPAHEAYLEATRLAPGDFRPWKALGELEASQGKFAIAIPRLEKALELARELNDRAPLYRSLAMAQQRLFKSAEALKTWQAMEKEFPEDPYVVQEIAEALAEAGSFDAATAAYERLRKLETSDPYQRLAATVALARLEEQRRKIPEAIAIYEAALQEAGAGSWIERDIRSRIEEIYRRDENLPGLVAYYEKWIGKNANDVEATVNLSRALSDLGQKKEAATSMAKAVALAPDRRELQVEHARLLNAGGAEEEAAKVLQRLTQAFPDETSYWELLGETKWLLFEKKKDDSHKTAALQSWSRLAPEGCTAEAAARLAALYRQHGLETEAIAQYERACALEPGSADLKEQLAEYLFALKREEKAWQLLGTLVSGDNAGSAAAYLRLATLQNRYGKAEEALASVVKGRTLEPENFGLLSLQWRLLNAAEKWDEAIALYEPMLAAAPSQYAMIEAQYIQLLTLSGKRDAVVKSLTTGMGEAAERDLRLLARLALDAGDVPLAQRALEEGRKRFPQSVPLAVVEAEAARADGDAEARIASLRRLIGLDGKQTASALREVAQAYQTTGEREKALAVGQELLAAAPADADARLFYGNLCLNLQKTEDGIAALREAIRLSDKPNAVRRRLARVLIDNERLPEAQQVYDEAFEAEAELQSRLNLLGEITTLAVQQGTIDALVAHFRERQNAEAGEWRHTLYLAEIFKKQGLFAEARTELAKALAQRPRDAALLKTLAALAENEGNLAEQARFQQRLVELDPSAENTRSLARTFVVGGEREKALALLSKNEEAFVKDPIPWIPVILDENAPVKPLLEKTAEALKREPEAFAQRLALAETAIALADWESAKATLRELRALPLPSLARDPAPDQAKPPGLKLAPLAATPAARTASANRTRNRFRQIIELKQRLPHDPYPSLSGPSKLSPVEIQDAALVYLASIAESTGEAEAFLADLARELDARKSSPMEKLVVYRILGSSAPLKKEVAIVLSQMEQVGIKEAPFLLELLEALGKRSTTTPEEAELYAAQSKALKARLEEGQKSSHKLAKNGLKEDEIPSDATALAALIETTAQTSSRDADYKILFNKAFSLKEYRLALSVIEKVPAQRGRAARLKAELLDRLTKELLQEKGPQLMELLPAVLETEARANTGRHSFGSLNGSPAPFSFETSLLSRERMQQLDQLSRDWKGKPELKKLTATLLNGDDSPAAVLAGAHLLWITREKAEAMKALSTFLDNHQSDEIRLVLGCMALQENKMAEAIAALQGVTPRNTALHQQALFLQAFAGEKVEDAALREAARRAAIQFVRLWPTDQALAQLLPQFSKLGLQEERREITLRLARKKTRGQLEQYFVQTLQEYRNAGAAEAARELALSLFNIPDQLLPYTTYVFSQAGSYLQESGDINKIAADLQAKAEAAADPVPYYIRLLNLDNVIPGNESGMLVEKILQLRPGDRKMRQALLTRLAQRNSETALTFSRTVFKEDPGATLNTFNLLYVYKNKKATEEYATFVLQALEQRPDKARLRDFCNNSLQQLISGLMEENKRDFALKILRKTMKLAPGDDPGMAARVRDQIIRLFLSEEDREAAIPEIEAYFLPATKPGLLWDLDETPSDFRNWISLAYGETSVPSATATTFLEELHKSGKLAGLREKVKALSEKLPSYKLLLTHIDLIADPKAGRDRLLQIIEKPDPQWSLSDGTTQGYFFVLANESAARLSDPKEKLQCLLALKPLLAKNGRGSHSMALPLHIARLAIDNGDKKLATETMRETLKDVQTFIQNGNTNIAVNSTEILIELGLFDECTELLTRLKETSEAKMQHSWLKIQIQSREAQLDAAQGDVKNPVGIATISIENGKPQLHWSISEVNLTGQGQYNGFINPQGIPPIPARSNPAVDGRFDVEILFGSGINTVERLALLPKVKATGTWNGTLPNRQGSIQLVLHDGKTKRRFIGSWITYCPSPNLVVNPTLQADATGTITGWKPASGISYKGTAAGIHTGQTCSAFVNTTNQETAIVGPRIPIKPGHAYFASAWIYGESHSRIAFKSYDAEGNYLATCDLYGYGGNTTKMWSYRNTVLRRDSQYYSSSQQLHGNAAFIEPFITLYRGEYRMPLLYVGEYELPEERQ